MARPRSVKITGGKLYGSKASAFQVIVQGKEPIRWNAAGNPVEWQKELVAEFGTHLGEFLAEDFLTKSTERYADIRGHYFDSAQQAEEKGWTQDEHDMVVESVDYQCKLTPEYVWEIKAAKAEKPWPKYDDAHHNAIPGLAEQLGLVAEALVYERQNKNRESVVKGLEDKLAATEVAAEAEEIVAA